MFVDERMIGSFHRDSQNKATSYMQNCGLCYDFMWSNFGREVNSILLPYQTKELGVLSRLANVKIENVIDSP